MAVTASSLLVCYQVYVDPVSFNVTLFGIFTGLRATRFPTPSREYSVYALLQGDPGERGELRLRCVDDPMNPIPPDNSSASEGDIWPVNDPPVVLSADATPHDSIKEEGEIQPVNDPVVTLRKSDL